MCREDHLSPCFSLQEDDLIDVLQESLEAIVGVLKALPKYQHTDDVGHSIVNKPQGIEWFTWEYQKSTCFDRPHATSIGTHAS